MPNLVGARAVQNQFGARLIYSWAKNEDGLRKSRWFGGQHENKKETEQRCICDLFVVDVSTITCHIQISLIKDRTLNENN